MYEVYIEQNNIRNNPKSGKGRALMYRILSYVFLALGIISLFLWQFTPIAEGAALWQILLTLVPMLIFTASFFVFAYFMRRAYMRANPEFDYILNGTVFRIVQVLNRVKRKRFFELRLNDINAIGVINSDSHDRYAADRNIKKLFALTNPEDEESIYYIYLHSQEKRYLLYFEPREELLITLKRLLGRNIFSQK